MIDPYPVPHMPMTWLSDCLEEAARYVPKERLWAVIQAFGGGKHTKDGWPRRPQKLEMRCLTYPGGSAWGPWNFLFQLPRGEFRSGFLGGPPGNRQRIAGLATLAGAAEPDHQIAA